MEERSGARGDRRASARVQDHVVRCVARARRAVSERTRSQAESTLIVVVCDRVCDACVCVAAACRHTPDRQWTVSDVCLDSHLGPTHTRHSSTVAPSTLHPPPVLHVFPTACTCMMRHMPCDMVCVYVAVYSCTYDPPGSGIITTPVRPHGAQPRAARGTGASVSFH